MKKIILLLFLSFYVAVTAQEKKHLFCASDELLISELKKNDVYKQKWERENALWQKRDTDFKPYYKRRGSGSNTPPPNPVFLNVVFHDMQFTPGTPSTSNYLTIVDALNTIYSGDVLTPLVKENASVLDKSGGTNTLIQFCLASKDINGDLYPLEGTGGSRHPSFIPILRAGNTSDMDNIVNSSGSELRFPTNRYINIYIVDHIAAPVAGFASMPSAHGTKRDGIFIERNFLSDFSADGSNLNYNMNVLAHEMGHYLGLFHVFGICNPDTINNLTIAGYNPCSCDNGNCLFNGDMVCDTPPSMLPEPPVAGGIVLNTCHTDNPDLPDARSNYMDYGDWYFQSTFSPDQKDRMHFIIDAITGPRKSLLGPISCVVCNEMNLCEFSITSPLSTTNNALVSGSTAQLTALTSSSCTAAIDYSWELSLLGNTNTPIENTLGGTYEISSSLIVGNYQLILRGTCNINVNCFEEVIYNFSVIPAAGNCNLVLPTNTDWGDFNRVSYAGGWTTATHPTDWSYGTTVRSTSVDSSFDSAGFEIVNSTAGDINFPTAQYPMPTGVTSLIRVGRVLNTGAAIPLGNAYYVSYTFHVSRDNCKFRIHSLGMREASPTTGNQNIQYNRFNFNFTPENATAFGYLCQYRFTSPVPNAQNPVTVGMGENGTLIQNGANWPATLNYGLNDMVSELHNNDTSNFSQSGNFRKMNTWSSQDLDFSEFADLNTDITITFFTHSNDASAAIYSAYSYFGLECLGGGIPKDVILNLPDTSVSCAFDDESCVTYELPIPEYAITCQQNIASSSYIGTFRYLSLPFGTINIYKSTVSGFVQINQTPIQPSSECPYSKYKVKLCLSSTDVPFEDFKIEYISLNKTVVQIVRVYVGFYHQTPPCVGQNEPFGGNIDPVHHPTDYMFWCPQDPLPVLYANAPCFPEPLPQHYEYIWATNEPFFNYIVGGANDASLTVPADYLIRSTEQDSWCSRQFVRKTKYVDPYCGIDQWFDSEIFTIYNKAGFNFSSTPRPDNICLNSGSSIVNVDIINLNLRDSGCIPNNLMSTLGSSVTLQLFNNGQPLSNSITFDISNFNLNTGNFLITPLATLSFDNLVSNGYLFDVGDHQIDLKITLNIDNCIYIKEYNNYVLIKIKPSAVGGIIQVLDTNCADTIASVSNISAGYTNPTDGYLWEVASTASGIFSTLDLSGTLNELINYDFSTLNSPSIFIRRKSFGVGQCSDPDYSNVVEIIRGNSSITPTFSFPTILCNGVVPPSLPTSSDNGVVGTWSPAIINAVASGTYTFTPSANQCANATTITTTIGTIQTPIFSLASTYCQTALPILPNTSNQGITGIWTPATVTATGNYIFQPNAGQCASPVTYSMNIVPFTTPTFSFPTFYCKGSVALALPLVSDNSISGTWSPATINTTTVGTFPYTFTATVNGACSFVTINITIRPIPIPTFSFPTTICQGTSIPVLPLNSDNGIAGSWLPATISNMASGVYTFTSTEPCVAPVAVYVTISTECGFYLSWGSDVGCEVGSAVRKLDSNIQDGGCLRVCENSVITYTINGNYSVISSIAWNITGGTKLSEVFPSVEIQWGSATYATLQFVITFTDNSQKSYSLCVQKLSKPTALFGVMPDITKTEYNTCADIPVHFENLSTSNAGNDQLYYNWDFGDNSVPTSEFEPSHTYTTPGTYTVTLVAYNGCSCVDEYKFTVKVDKPSLEIECVGVACEGDRISYTVPFDQGSGGARCDFKWTVTGGNIDNTNGNQVSIVWNQVDETGFGYLSVQTENCDNCQSPNTTKIPVVTKIGKIQGRSIICQKSESIYSLPKWPSTEFEWEVNDFGTGAFLINSIQRNEVILKTGSTGTILLTCSYKNTLLGCSGTATLEITVQPSARLVGQLTVCENTTFPYRFENQQGNAISNINWTVTGPQDYILQGTTANFNLTLPREGIYNIEMVAPGYCSSRYSITVKKAIIAPTAIVGPTTTCPGIPVTYTCVSMAGTITHWEVQNGTIAGGANSGNEIQVNFNPLATGPYIVKVWYADDFCSSAILSTTILRDIPNVSLQSGDTSVCGSTFMDYVINNVNAESYIWSISQPTAGSIESGQNTISPRILWNQTSGTSTVNLHLEVKKCGKSYHSDFPITIYNAPQLTLSLPPSVCNENSFNLNFSLTPSGTFTSILVDYGDNSQTSLTYVQYLANPGLLSHAYSDAISGNTTRTVSMTVQGVNGCPSPSTATADIVVAPTPIISLSPVVDLNLCDSQSAFNTASHFYSVAIQSGFGQTYTIKWFRTNNSGTTNVTDPLNPATIDAWSLGEGTYWAVVTNNFGCTQETERFYVVFNCGGTGCVSTLEGIAINTACGKVVASISVTDPNAQSTFWGNNVLPGAEVTTNDQTTFAAKNIEPGNYNLKLCGEYIDSGVTCITCKDVPLVIPYKAGIKYNIECQGNSVYKVTLLDHSVYNPLTPITLFEFTTDYGLNWTTGIPISGIMSHTTNLPPGTYQVGIRISRPGLIPAYPYCDRYETIVLPELPSAEFTPSIACQGSATEFSPQQTSGVDYVWTFLPDGSSNLQQHPFKTYSPGISLGATLLVTNQYGCWATKTNSISLTPVLVRGIVTAVPADACEGGTVTVNYLTAFGFPTPSSIEWYKDELTASPIAITPGTVGLTVTTSGAYFAHAIGSNTCKYTSIASVPVMFVPTPDAPMVDGTAVICQGGRADVFVPTNPSVFYTWMLDGAAQPQWDNRNRVNQQFLNPGNYTFSVTAATTTAGGVRCTSPTAIYVVTVTEKPEVPLISFELIKCNPYQVKVFITNVQPGVDYYWSNGGLGAETTMTHGGPIRVRAVLGECIEVNQDDLPLDLETLAWVFPKGCYEICKGENPGYMIGPLGSYQNYGWMQHGEQVLSGSGDIPPFGVVGDHTFSYGLFLETQDCDKLIAPMTMTVNNDCKKCNTNMYVKDITTASTNDGLVCWYILDLEFDNTNSMPIMLNLTASNGEGYFSPNSILIQPGLSSATVAFFPLSGFVGGTVQIFLNGRGEGFDCFEQMPIAFPELCSQPRPANGVNMRTSLSDLLLVAPNPSKGTTTIYYDFGEHRGNKSLELYDYLGRRLFSITPNERQGQTMIDAEHYADGSYFIFMKVDGLVVKKTKLIIQAH